MARIVITGGSGFIGTNLVDLFAARGDEVLNLDVARPRNPDHRVFWTFCDLRNGEALRNCVREFAPQFILHMGARTDLQGASVEDYAANTKGVDNLVAAVEGLDSVERLIFASSRLVCRIGYQPAGDDDYCPTTAYGESKVIGEKAVRSAARRIPCPWMIVRPTSIWGPWFDVPYKTFFLTIARGLYVHPGTAGIPKSFGFIGNTVYQLDKLLQAPREMVSGKTMYLADYPPVDVTAMANVIQQALGVRPIRTVSRVLLRLVAAAGDLGQLIGWHNPPLTSFRLDNLVTPMVHDLEPLEGIVGPLPYSMEEGVRITVRWMRSQGEVA